MTDLDQIALDTAEAIANIDPDKLKGGRVQALAQAQCLVRDALRELEEVGAENYTLTQEVDAALEQIIYWRERAVSAEAERDALGNRVDFLNQQNSVQQEQNDALAAHVVLGDTVAEVCIEKDYWNRGHFYEGRRKELKVASSIQDLPVGTKLYAAQQPAAGLARLKAEWQAGALDQLLPAICDVADRAEVRNLRDELRRQAEEMT